MRNFLNVILQEAVNGRSQSNIRNIIRNIRHYKSFNPILKAIKNCNREIIIKPEVKAKSWEEYLKNY